MAVVSDQGPGKVAILERVVTASARLRDASDWCDDAACMRSSSPARYPSDLTDEQWHLIAPMVPVKPGGRPTIHSRRRIIEAILYVNRTGCSWRQLPHDFPPWDTVYWYFKRWNADGTTDRIHDALRAATRDAAGRVPGLGRHRRRPVDQGRGHRRGGHPRLRRRQEIGLP